MPPFPSDRDDLPARSTTSGRAPASPALAIVVSRSGINLVVLSKIAERSALRPVCVSPDDAAQLIARTDPAVIVLDGGRDLRECDAAMESIIARKRLDPHGAPFVIMLTPNNDRPDEASFAGVDAYVSKPVTPERLQPLMETARDSRR